MTKMSLYFKVFKCCDIQICATNYVFAIIYYCVALSYMILV